MKERNYVREYYEAQQEAVEVMTRTKLDSPEFKDAEAKFLSIMKEGVEAHDTEMAKVVVGEILDILEDFEDFEDKEYTEGVLDDKIKLLESNGFWYLISEAQEDEFCQIAAEKNLRRYMATRIEVNENETQDL